MRQNWVKKLSLRSLWQPGFVDICLKTILKATFSLNYTEFQGGHELWKTGKTGKMVKNKTCREKSGNLEKS